ncbi:hypothetical protein LOTGIDRAFT_157862 [Lottia gigantea]|uniref:Apple domain-containing protein n=1 Tax=Lottia gigantea TaxID=225164 RepID=V4ATG6_LOTGI|nr:hypothetical protein LOTGIDRAFT_157862 [Lottia gigantea]ESP00583.1 hypothetical protein LOTGIDRAFT_157862 [Lottia gigantea]
MLLNRTLITIIIFVLLDVRQSSASNNFISGLMNKVVENETISNNAGSWLEIRSNVYCGAFCLRDPSCTGFQFGDVVNGNVTNTSCSLLYGNVSLLTRDPMPGISIYSLEREPFSEIESTTQESETITLEPKTTTLPPHGPCSVDAAFTRQFDIVIIAGVWMYIYNSSAMLSVGPMQSIPVQTFLPGWSGSVAAAYMDSTTTFLYMITENKVKTYRMSDKMLQSTETTDQHYSSFPTVPPVIDAAIHYNGKKILISSDEVYTTTGSVPLSSKGSANVFDYLTTSPSGITGAALSWIARTPLFFAGSAIHVFQPNVSNTQGFWAPYGFLKCTI